MSDTFHRRLIRDTPLARLYHAIAQAYMLAHAMPHERAFNSLATTRRIAAEAPTLKTLFRNMASPPVLDVMVIAAAPAESPMMQTTRQLEAP